MKSLMLISVILLVGCGKSPEEEVVGSYELKDYKYSLVSRRMVFLENGVYEGYVGGNGGKKLGEAKWKIVDGEIYVEDNKYGEVFRINEDGSLTFIAVIDKSGKRKDSPKAAQSTWNKIK